MKLGAHLSIAGGFHLALLRGSELGCDTVQIFTKNSVQWRAAPITPVELNSFLAARECLRIEPVFAHSAYLINLASPDRKIYARSLQAFAVELERAALLDLPFLVFHPGSHAGKGEREGLERLIRALDELLCDRASGPLAVVETTAGQGGCLGYRFEHLAEILQKCKYPGRLGFCLDTSHVFAAGYDIRSLSGLEETLSQFEMLVGLRHLAVIHLNDSLKPLGSRIDRHTHIGEGYLGLQAFAQILNHPRLRHLPMVIETPKLSAEGKDMDRTNLTILRSLKRNER